MNLVHLSITEENAGLLRQKPMRTSSFLVYAFGLAVAACLLTPLRAHAQASGENESLAHFSTAERATLAPLLARGPVALIEFSEGEALPGIVFAVRVRASADVVARLVGDPAGYSQFMDALDTVSVTGRRASTVSYDWTWQTAVFEMQGSNQLTAYPPPADHPERGYRFAVESTRGDLGRGRFVWRIYPTGANECLLSLAMRVDLRDANYIARQMSGASRSVNRAVNISFVTLMALGTRREAERLVGAAALPATPHADAPNFGDFDIRPFASLLARGDILSLEMNGDALAQVTAIGRMGAPVERVRNVIHDPHSFGASLIPGSSIEVTSNENGRQVFEWSIAVPMVGSSGSMALYERDDAILVDGVDGNLHAGRWRFLTPIVQGDEAGLVATGTFDVSDTSFLIRALVGSNQDFGVGLTAASELMVTRAIRNRTLSVDNQ